MKISRFIMVIVLLIALIGISFYAGYQMGSLKYSEAIYFAGQYKNISEQALHGWNESLVNWINCEASKINKIEVLP